MKKGINKNKEQQILEDLKFLYSIVKSFSFTSEQEKRLEKLNET